MNRLTRGGFALMPRERISGHRDQRLPQYWKWAA